MAAATVIGFLLLFGATQRPSPVSPGSKVENLLVLEFLQPLEGTDLVIIRARRMDDKIVSVLASKDQADLVRRQPEIRAVHVDYQAENDILHAWWLVPNNPP